MTGERSKQKPADQDIFLKSSHFKHFIFKTQEEINEKRQKAMNEVWMQLQEKKAEYVTSQKQALSQFFFNFCFYLFF